MEWLSPTLDLHLPDNLWESLKILLLAAVAYHSTLIQLLIYMVRCKPKFPHGKPFESVTIAHNVFLSLLSLLMHIQATYAIYRIATNGTVTDNPLLAHTARHTSWKDVICTPQETPFPPQFHHVLSVFLVSKWYEFFDTLILVLRGRPLTLLHVWHHTTVMLEVFGWMHYHVALGMIGMWFNTLVHVFMYAYYAACIAKLRVRGKVLITIMQIVQFVTGFATLLPFVYLHLRSAHGPCDGVPGLAISSFLNGSYLVLFVLFFRRTYQRKKAKAK